MGNCLNYMMNLWKQHKTHRISGRKLRQVKQIAEGGYGFVLLVEDVESHKNYAMKKLVCQTEQSRANYKKQISIMKELSDCSYIIGYFGSHQIQRQGFLEAYILMELAQKTVLDVVLDAINKKKQLSQSSIIKIILQTAKGLQQMHDRGIIHKDVKVQNILISQSGRAKLCDFGSCDKQQLDLAKMSKSQMYKYEQKFQKNTTLMYRPPEMIDLYLRFPIDERVDVWMLGCVLFVLNFRVHPFQDSGKLSIVNASIKYPKSVITLKMENLIRNMLTPNPNYRIKIPEVIQILENWITLRQVNLNKIASIIKQNQNCIEAGQYEQAVKKDWRNVT